MATTPDSPTALTLPIAQIRIPERLREVDPDYVDGLKTSIALQGITTPLTVRPARDATAGGKWGKAIPGTWDLVAGAHRLQAARELGLAGVPALIIDPASPDEARLAEIDENLVRHELSPLDRASFLAERKAIHERLFPETRQHAAGGHAKAGSASDTMSFAESTAARLNISRKTIERAVRIAACIPPELRRRIARDRLIHTQAELLALADLEPSLRPMVVDLLADGTAKTVRAAVERISGRALPSTDAATVQLRRLKDRWVRASLRVRRQFIQELHAHGEIPAEWLSTPNEEEEA
ncbi:chromosome partitioning protein, ParB family [Tistlia consotensis]|uniref:Chromosome partitioning protein, ParB family n=1 Tax=Tistlia consotensis USBA 355 TaxID=560819 RepID=A0A1Y6CR02_9PROT|nr:ParB/RepB/Spo0J family partition protein [Tistlia consotensis]SMF82844.1 chromosome partitioning protein, ParB family [Tistlia consotensis USBA 355]SNS31060.1 chromosome partitioning protein, ParB family [Tistlia consotensis]